MTRPMPGERFMGFWDRAMTNTLDSAPVRDTKPDMVDHPPHYTGGAVETIDAVSASVRAKSGNESMAP